MVNLKIEFGKNQVRDGASGKLRNKSKVVLRAGIAYPPKTTLLTLMNYTPAAFLI